MDGRAASADAPAGAVAGATGHAFAAGVRGATAFTSSLAQLPPSARAQVLERLQRAAGNRSVARLVAQRQVEAPPAGAPTNAGQPAATRPTGLIVDDTVEDVEPQQMKRGQFISQARSAATAAAEGAVAASPWATLARPRVAQELEQLFSTYAGQDAATLERTIRQQVPAAAGASSAGAFVSLIAEQVRKQVLDGLPEGEPPGTGLADAAASAAGGIASAAGDVLAKVGSLLFKGREGGARAPADALSVRARLGRGRSLPDPVRTGMESAFGEDFSRVRIHADPGASRVAGELGARAFTVGSDIAFGAGEFEPGTPVGDALIAHELAHVAQQKEAVAEPVALRAAEAETSALEEDADLAAVGAVAALWSSPRAELARFGAAALPRLRSGLRLQRCTPDHGERVKKGMESANTKKDPKAGLWYWPNYRGECDKRTPGFTWDDKYLEGFSKTGLLTRTSTAFEWELVPGAKPSDALREWLAGLTIADCASVAVAVEYDTVRASAGNEKFDDHFGKKEHWFKISQYPSRLPLRSFLMEPEASWGFKVGDWYYFKNHEDYKFKHPRGLWQGENAIFQGSDKWSGFGATNMTESEMLKTLLKEYNNPRTRYDEDRLAEIRRENSGTLPSDYLFEEEGGKLKKELKDVDELVAGGGGMGKKGWRPRAKGIKELGEGKQ